METPIKISDASPEPPVRGESLLRKLEEVFLWADRSIERWIPAQYNPLAQTGALANVSFLIALVTGVLLLFWYVPSVHRAWGSLEDMGFLGETARSLHRYSSDATIFFVLVHWLRMTFARRFAGARWIAWVTGIVLVGLLWLVGWLGYWLVWDVRAETLARASARVVEVLPVFTEPLSRSFLLDEMVSTGLFFLVFFLHMLLPLAMGVALWMHISRVSRARFLTSGVMTAWLFVALFIVSLVFPATSAEQAQIGAQSGAFTTDWWYLLPLALTERLSGGALVAVGLGVTAIVTAVPWWMTREKPQKAVVDLARCNGCTQCVQDCPYNAIVMVPRTDGHPRREIQAEVDPDKCVGCGICAGSCNPGGVGLPQLPVQDERRRFDRWIDEMIEADEKPCLAFLCSNSAAADISVGPDGRSAELPGYRVFPVPCAGWVQAMTIERAIRRGAECILIAGCSSSDPPYREGVKWTRRRLAGEREPELRHEKVDTSGVRFVQYNRTQKREFLATAAEHRRENLSSPDRPYTRTGIFVAAVLTSIALAAVIVGFSDTPSLIPTRDAAELVVSVKHRPEAVENCRELTADEKKNTMKHMQTPEICERKRPDVEVEVEVDGDVHEMVLPARGLSSDGPGIGTQSFAVEPGTHEVNLRVGHVGIDEWPHSQRFDFDFEQGTRRVVVFDTREGFRTNAGD
ncbi:MAG: hydrogenase iron-sulfur subunit [Myxococcota bacterium]